MSRRVGGVLMTLWLTASAQAADVGELIRELQSDKPDVRRNAALELGKPGEQTGEAVAALTKALKDEDSFVRRFAAQSLGAIGADAKSAVPALTTALKDREARVVSAVAAALGKMGAEGVRPLIGLLKNRQAPPEAHRQAIHALGEMGESAAEAAPTLAEYLKSRELRLQAAVALGEMGPGAKAAEETLKEIAADRIRDRPFKAAVQKALRNIRDAKKKAP